MGDSRPEFLYYQIAGFRPNVTLQGGFQYDMRKLAQAIFGSKSSVDLVLGIRPSGASSILIPASEWTKKEEFNYPGAPQRASDFLSLSPLKFNSTILLTKKFNALKPKGKRRGEDDSPANKIYLGSPGNSGQSRSAFEYNRLFFNTLKPSFEFWRFGLSRASPWASAQIISLVFNEWTHEKGVILDIGWSSITSEKQRFGNRGKQRTPFQYGQTEVLKMGDIPTRIRELLICEQPLILLVHDEDAFRDLLKGLNIDTGNFASGLKDMLQPESRGAYYRSQSTYRDSRHRSRSPRRDEKWGDQRRRTPSPPETKPPVCLVDVRQLYITLRTRFAESDVSLVTVATELGLTGDDKTMCAGNESRLLAEVWTAMAGGPAIDDQYDARWGPNAVRPKSSASAAGGVSGGSAPPRDPNDADFDPNDLPPASSSANARPSRPSQMPDWDELGDDEEEFFSR